LAYLKAGLASLVAVLCAAAITTPADAQLFRSKKKKPPVAAAPAPPPALTPSVRNGVELWRKRDWAGAVTMWQPFANAGDPDAMFNIGQAHKLGRAVPRDAAVAREWYRKAALKGHRPAQANLGILLFQNGEKSEAMTWLKQAADADEMRAQYVYGIANWNGDSVPRSLTLAYAYLARAAAQGLPEATTALDKLTQVIAPVERANGWAIATSLGGGRGIPAALAALDPRRSAMGQGAQAQAPVPQTPSVSPATIPAARQVAAPKPAPPPAAKPAPAPPVATAQATGSPAMALQSSGRLPAAKPAAAATLAEIAPPPQKPRATPAWRVQLGAFSQRSLAEAAWADMKKRKTDAVAGAKPFFEPSGSVTRLQLGPYSSQQAARDACDRMSTTGLACFVING